MAGSEREVMASHKIEVKKIVSGATINVTVLGLRQWRWRLWVSKQLIRLACWISWMDCNIANENGDENVR